MKKVLRLIILLFVLVPIIGQAKSYEVDSTISIDFDSDWYVFTRSNYKGNEDLASLGITEEQMLSIFDSNFIYVDAVNKKDVGNSFYSEFFVRRVAIASNKDMKDYTEKELDEFGESFIEALPTDEYEVYKNSNNTYLRINFTDTLQGVEIHMEEYVTVYNGFAYSFGLQATERKLSDSEIVFVKNKVDNLVYKDENREQENPIKKEETKEDKEETKKEDSKLDYVIISLIIICSTIIIVTLIITVGKVKKLQK